MKPAIQLNRAEGVEGEVYFFMKDSLSRTDFWPIHYYSITIICKENIITNEFYTNILKNTKKEFKAGLLVFFVFALLPLEQNYAQDFLRINISKN